VEAGEDGKIRITVSDSGIGIAAEDIPTALSVFGQVESTLNRRFEGTGLGLPLVKSLVELHGGGLEIDSQPGHGTAATIWLPEDRIVVS
jgi:signal transduction histidine kinase